MGGSAKKPMEALVTGGMSVTKEQYDSKTKVKRDVSAVGEDTQTAQTAEQEAEKKRKRQSIFTAEGGSVDTATNRGTVFGN